MKPVVVRRSAIRMWLMAILAVPFVLYGADVLLQQRFVNMLLELMHPDGEVPAIETRDVAWAWMFVIVGGATAVWALKELILPRRVVEADPDEMRLSVAGPFRGPTAVPWSAVSALRPARASDDGDVFPVLVVDFVPGAVPHQIPDHPWGARWVDVQRLAVSARDWDRPVSRVVEQLDRARRAADVVVLEERPPVPPAAAPPDALADVSAGTVGAGPAADASRDPHWVELGASEGRGTSAGGRSRSSPRSGEAHWIIIEDPEDG